MNKWLYFAAFAIIFIFAMRFLYRQGFVICKQINAIWFVFRPAKTEDRVSLNAGSGWVKHTGRFRENRTYYFNFEEELSKGDAEVFLLDQEKQPLLRLNKQSPTGSVELDGRSKYYLRWEFRSATGTCKVSW